MRPAVISYDDVKRVAIRLISKGRQATIDAIHSELGHRGSRTTVHKHRLAFFEELQQRGVQVLPASLPEALIPLIEDFWTQAVQRAGEAFGDERTALEGRAHELAGQLAAAEAATAQKEACVETQQQLIEKLTEQVSALQDESATHQAYAKDYSEQLAKSQDRFAAYRRQISDERAVQEQLQGTERAEWQREKEHLEAELEAANARLSIEVKRSDDQATYWYKQVDNARLDLARMDEQRQQEVHRLESELLIGRKREESLARRMGKLEDQYDAKVAEVESLRGKLEQARANLREQEKASQLDKADLLAQIRELEGLVTQFRTEANSGASGTNGE